MGKRKMFLALLMIFTMFFSNLPFAQIMVSHANSDDLVYHENFESGLGGFLPSGEAVIDRTNETAVEGEYSLHVSGRTENWHGAQLDVTSIALRNGRYAFSAYVKGEVDAQQVMSLQIARADSSETFDWIDNVVVGEDWVRLYGEFTIPSNASQVFLNFETDGGTTEFFVDDVSIRLIEMLEVEPESPNEGDLAEGELFRASFENNAGGFTGRSAAVRRSTDEAFDGSHSLFVFNRSTYWHGAQVNLTNRIVPHGKYRFEAHVLGTVPATYRMSLQVNAGGNTWITLDDVESNGEWVKLSGEWTAPANFSDVQLNFETAQGLSDGIEEFFVDEVVVYALGDTVIPDFDTDKDAESGLDYSLSLPSLHESWEEHFIMGNIYTPQTPFDGRHYILNHHFGHQITAENIMKPESMQPTRGTFNFGAAHQMMEYARENDLKVVGHTLLWHQQSLPWMNEAFVQDIISRGEEGRQEAIELMKNHIRTVMEEFKDDVFAWDVVNEAIAVNNSFPHSDWRAQLRDTKWLRMIGPEYIEIAFRYAHEVDPNAILYYNDYNLNIASKATAVYYMVKELRGEGVPIHRIGMQGHYNQGTNMVTVENSINLFRQIDGIELSITELDITVAGAESESRMPEANAILQGQLFAQLFQILRENSDIIQRVTFWGMDDPNSWRADRHPTLFHGDLSPKPAFFAVLNPEQFLREHPVEDIEFATQVIDAVYGTPTIGTFDMDVWDTANSVNVNNFITAWNGARAQARVLWDTANLYVLLNVTDNNLDATHYEAHQQDSVEVFLSQNNTKSLNFQPGDYQIRVNYRGEVSWGSQGVVEGFESAVELTGNGYRVEMRIPLSEVGFANRVMGMDFQINDATNGSRQSIAKWNDLTDMSWQSTEHWGEVRLIGTEEEVVTPPGNNGGTNNGGTNNGNGNQGNNNGGTNNGGTNNGNGNQGNNNGGTNNGGTNNGNGNR